MNPTHHPAPDILAEYAAGALEPGFGLVVGAHVQSCALCRARISAFEAASGQALEFLAPTPMNAGALDVTLARLSQKPRVETAKTPPPLLDRLSLKPKRWVAPGVWVAAVDTPHAPTNRVYLLSVPPGGATAHHGHEGMEFCTVLRGAYRDGDDLFAAGDFAAADRGLDHQPIVASNDHCVCLFATEGRLKAYGVLARMAFAYANV
jgi:putative transcriptional regulator